MQTKRDGTSCVRQGCISKVTKNVMEDEVMKRFPKVSIIIPCYNKGKYVKAAVESALHQTYSNIEIVCIDDASTDNSREILRHIANERKNVVLIEESSNVGVCRARNKAINFASGEYILPLDADDTIEPTYVEKAITIFTTNPAISIVYSRCRDLSTKKELFVHKTLDTLLFRNVITCSSIFKKTAFSLCRGYDPALTDYGCEDWDLYLSFLENGLLFHKIDEILFNYRTNTEKNRSVIQKIHSRRILEIIFENHINLYKKDRRVIENIFTGDEYKQKNIKMKRKCKRYKGFTILLFLAIILETAIVVTKVLS